MTKLCKGAAMIALAAVATGAGVAGLAGWNSQTASATGGEIDPIAKYEFKDANDFGKDSMGNYHMSYRNLWQAGSTGPLLDKGTLIDGGGVRFENEFCISQDKTNNMFADVSAFTLAFEISIENGSNSDAWGHYIGVENGAKEFAVIAAADGATHARLMGSGIMNKNGTESMSGYWNSSTLLSSGNASFQKVIISAQPGGQLKAWVDGVEVSDDWLPATLADDWTPYNNDCTFSIGARWNGAADRCSTGAMKNVVCYNFAMDAACVAAYSANGKVTTDDISGMKRITDISVTEDCFTDGEPTKVALNATMSLGDMLSQLNAANATLTYSDSSTSTSPVSWTEVVKEGMKYIAKGTVNTGKIGYINQATSGDTVSFELEVADVESISDPVFPENAVFKSAVKDSMTNEAILAAVNKATVTLTLGGGTTQNVEVTFTRVENNMGKYTAYGDVVLNGNTVGTVVLPLEVPVDNEGDFKELLPIAKYEFKDAENPGKDTMGNYNLGKVAKEGGDLGNPYGTGTITEDGRLYLGGQDMLACDGMNDVGDNIGNGFTLNFQIQQDGVNTKRGQSVSFGFNDWNVSQACFFFAQENSQGLHIGAKDIAYSDTPDKNIYYGPSVLANNLDKMHNVTLSVRPGEKFRVYVDGVQALEKDCPSDWTLKNSNMSFALGGACVWGNGYDLWKGWLDNVSIYNFAMSLEQSNALWAKGKIVVADMNGEVVTSISQTPKFENDKVTSGKLTDALTATQAVRRVNKATVDAVFANEQKVALPVTWQKLEKEGEKWYIVGVVDPSNIGYATVLEGVQTVKQEVEVERAARKITVADASNGTAIADKTEAYLGDTVTLTLTPAEGYEVDTVEVNGKAIAAADGVYSFVIEGIDNYEVSATFKVATSTDPGNNGDGAGESGCGGCGSSLTLGVGSVLMISGVALTVVFVSKKRKD